MKLFLLIFFSVPLTAICSDHFISPPTSKDANKYANNCGDGYDSSMNLGSEMGPLRNQSLSPWCSTFSVDAIVEYNMHLANPAYSYGKALSVVDINSQDLSHPEEDQGENANISGGSSSFKILEGMQNFNKVYLEADLPFDQKMFADPILDRLSDFYDMQFKVTNGFKDLQCADSSIDSLNIEKEIPDILEIMKLYKSKERVFDAIGLKISNKQFLKKGAQRINISPFNVRQVVATNADAYMQELKANLKRKQPSIAYVCATQMKKLPQFQRYNPIPPALADSCGAHELVVAGISQSPFGGCYLLIRNSWGTNWADPNTMDSHGNVWIKASDFLKILGDEPSLTSISPRATNDPIKNEIQNSQGYFSGTFSKDYRLIDGNCSFNINQNLHYEGPVKDGNLVGGKYTNAMGVITDPSGNPIP